MSLKTWLMPPISERLLSRKRLLARRARTERHRQAEGRRHRVDYFHQVDDPYSALVAGVLSRLAARYDIDLVPHLVGPPSDAAAPERDKLIAYSRRDAAMLAAHWALPFKDPGAQPTGDDVLLATRLLAQSVAQGRFLEVAGQISELLWRSPQRLTDLGTPSIGAVEVAAHLRASEALRQRLGHYLGGTLHYGGEWYWGLDRLYHLEQRLQDLGAQRPGVRGPMFAPDADSIEVPTSAVTLPIDFFFSLRSPYSAIVAPRVFELGRRTGVPVRLRFVLPMVMRGLPVPREKRTYISQDAAREAFVRGIPFGRLNDPVGRPAERGLALVPFAEQAGRGEAFVLSFMRGVWAEGVDAGSDRGLRTLVERAGLSWDGARIALRDESWRQTAELNRKELFDLGLWGVPSFRVGDMAVWGQDRLWAVRDALSRAGAPNPVTEVPR